MSWMIANQLSRRNLKPDQITLLIGQRYNLEKKTISNAEGKNQHTKEDGDQNDPQPNTAQQIADQHGISEKTVRNAEKFADAVKITMLRGTEYNLRKKNASDNLNQGTQSPKGNNCTSGETTAAELGEKH